MAQALHPHPQVGRALAWLRQRSNLRQVDVGLRLHDQGEGVSAVWLSQVERGHRQPSWKLVHALLRAYGVTLAEFDVLLDEQPWQPGRVAPASFGATYRSIAGAASAGIDRAARRPPEPAAGPDKPMSRQMLGAAPAGARSAQPRPQPQPQPQVAAPSNAGELAQLLEAFLALAPSQRLQAIAAVRSLGETNS